MLVIWIVVRGQRRTDVAGWVRLCIAAVIGAVPFLLAVGAYNMHFFGSPLRFGYVAAQGPLVGVGFHEDPFGHFYGPAQALGYTSSDLLTLSLYLLETPIPVVIVVGLFLVFRRKFSAGEQLIATWALLPVVANIFYWYHGNDMGPRMLNEAAPAWALLTAIVAVGLVRMTTRRQFGSYSPRAMVTVAFVLAWAAGIFYLAPSRLKSYGAWMASGRFEPPHTTSPSLIFVHGAWSGRVVMRLIANGLRLDSLDIGIRQNTTCEFQQFAHWYAAAKAGQVTPRPDVDFNPASLRRPAMFLIADDDIIRANPGQPMPQDCMREIAADSAAGIIDISSFLWQTDLPGLTGDGTMIVRDMGPEANARLIAQYPERTPMFFYRSAGEGRGPKLVAYAEGLKRLWR